MKRIPGFGDFLNWHSKAILQNAPLTKYFHLRGDVLDHLYKVRQWIFQTSIKYSIFLNAILLLGASREGMCTKFQGSPLWISGNLNALSKAERYRSVKTFWIRCSLCLAVVVKKNCCITWKNDDGKMQAKVDRWVIRELIKLISRSTKKKTNVQMMSI